MRDRELRDVCANYDIGYLTYGYASRLRGGTWGYSVVEGCRICQNTAVRII
jgi:hypothetical protein